MENNKAVVFQCGNEEYAISVYQIISIEKLEQITPIPHLPDYFLGVMKIRGELVPILDFEHILYGTHLSDEDAKIVVVKTDDLYIGLLVREAKEILDLPQDVLTTAGLTMYSKTRYFTAIANLEKRMITIVDPEKLYRTLEGMEEISEYVEAQMAPEE